MITVVSHHMVKEEKTCFLKSLLQKKIVKYQIVPTNIIKIRVWKIVLVLKPIKEKSRKKTRTIKYIPELQKTTLYSQILTVKIRIKINLILFLKHIQVFFRVYVLFIVIFTF